MEPDYFLKRGDAEPALTRTLRDVDGEPVNLTGADVRFYMTKRGEQTPTVEGDATVDATPTTGKATYSWQSGDTDDPGDYDAEFEVIYSGGGKQTFPNNGYLHIRIMRDLADEVSA